MPINDDKIVQKILENIEKNSSGSLKELIQGIIQRAYYYESKLKVNKRVTLKNGTKQTYYMIPIPIDAIKYGKIDPEQKYRIELYPLENDDEKEKKNNFKYRQKYLKL